MDKAAAFAAICVIVFVLFNCANAVYKAAEERNAVRAATQVPELVFSIPSDGRDLTVVYGGEKYIIHPNESETLAIPLTRNAAGRPCFLYADDESGTLESYEYHLDDKSIADLGAAPNP